MISERIWDVIAQIKEIFGFMFIDVGDLKQSRHVNEDHIDLKNSWIVNTVSITRYTN